MWIGGAACYLPTSYTAYSASEWLPVTGSSVNSNSDIAETSERSILKGHHCACALHCACVLLFTSSLVLIDYGKLLAALCQTLLISENTAKHTLRHSPLMKAVSQKEKGEKMG